jgi:dolichol-phosphate mannosyltransferase
LPFYNQADHLEMVIEGYLSVFESLKHSVELVLVINGKDDGSIACAQKLEVRHPNVRAFHNGHPAWGYAVKTGLAKSHGELLCYTNSARTSPHMLAMHIIVALANPGCMIKANRRLRHPFVRRIGSVLYNAQCRQLFDLPVWDVNGTPKIFSREVYQMLDLREDGDLIDVEAIIKCRDKGIRILEIPIVSTVRHGGESTTNYMSAVKMYWGAFRLWRNYRPRRHPSGEGYDH